MERITMNKKRLRNYALWIALLSGVADVLIYTNVIPIDHDTARIVIQRLLEIAVLGGIVSNPTKPDSKFFNL